MRGRTSLVALFIMLAAGCITPEPRYAFSLVRVPHPGWTRFVAGPSDPQGLQFRLENAAAGAEITVFTHGTFVRSPASLAAELRVHFADSDVVASDVDDADPDFARFRLENAAKGRRGEVVVMRHGGVRHRVAAVGWWPAADDAVRRADMERLLRNLDVIPLD